VIVSCACFILAGGKSSRFGTNKSLALVNSHPMAKIVASNMQSGFGCEAKLIGADQQTSMLVGLETFNGYREGNGPLAAIIDAMEVSVQELVAFAPNDTPFFTASNFGTLLVDMEDPNVDVAVAVDETDTTRAHWLLSVWRKSTCLPKLLAEYDRGERSIHGAVKGLNIASVAYGATSVRNINAVIDLPDRGTI
jgi:molybdopterin-guanine dinucleotide biosynthesis protein A